MIENYLNKIICADCLQTMKEMPSNMELTKKQIERQDFVDNMIFDLLKTLNPTNKQLDWDIEMIAVIRDMISDYFVDIEICKEQEFYPSFDK